MKKITFAMILSLTLFQTAFSSAWACAADQLCRGDRIISSNNFVGTVLEVFHTGQVSVDFDHRRLLHGVVVNARALGKGFQCVESLCQGDRVADTNGWVGTALEIFDNGKVKVEFDRNGVSIRSLEELGIELRCDLQTNCYRRPLN